MSPTDPSENEPRLIIIHNHTALRGDEHTWATSHSKRWGLHTNSWQSGWWEVMGRGSRAGATMAGPQDTFPFPCTLFLPPLQHVNDRHELPSLLIDFDREHNKVSERLKTSPHVQFYIHSLDMCTHNIMSEQTLLCPVTILLEYKLISKLLESSRFLVNKRQRWADTEQNLH